MLLNKTVFVALTTSLFLLGGPASQAGTLSSYTIKQLLEPCVEGDNDSRWGATAEAECEQYITGFIDAFVMTADGGQADGVCLPEANRADEVRWAFMRWAHDNYDQRERPAAEGLMAAIKAHFACK
jgi:hypothetical protein